MAINRRTFSDQELAFLAAIHEDPRDDAVRLIYADWLDEHGQLEQAEFIRLQCKTAKSVATYVDCGYTARERGLLRKFGTRWRGQRRRPGNQVFCAMHPRWSPGWGAMTFLRFHRGLPEAEVKAFNDDPTDLRLDAIAGGIPPHFQLLITYTIHAHRSKDPLTHWNHPAFSRAYRIHLRAGGQTNETATLTDAAVRVAVAMFRDRKVQYIQFEQVTSESKLLIEAELSPRLQVVIQRVV